MRIRKESVILSIVVINDDDDDDDDNDNNNNDNEDFPSEIDEIQGRASFARKNVFA